MARGRAAGFETQRELILARAAELFARQGYAGTSMNQIAEAAGLSKATLYHYGADKHALLVSIAEGHVLRLRALVAAVQARRLAPEAALRALIQAFVRDYAGARHAHRVLTEDVKFIEPPERERILATEREVVAAFAAAVAALRPELAAATLAKPLAMLLFGMINWMFTWVRAEGPLDHESLAPIVADLFLGGLPGVAAGLDGKGWTGIP
jgi:AcrR family transcriptional regulator